jgi:hypothetical protein
MLTTVIEKLGTMGLSEDGVLVIGLISLTAVVTAVTAAALALSTSEGKLVKGARGLIVFGTAIALLTKIIEKLGTMGVEEDGVLTIGLISLTAVMTALTAASLALSSSQGKLIKGASGLIVFAGAIMMLSTVIEKLGTMGVDEDGVLVIGLLALAGVITILTAAALALAMSEGGLVKGATALLLMATALAVLTPLIKIFSKMQLAEIGKALLVLVGVFGAFALGGLLLKPVAGILLTFSAAILALGIACLTVSASLTMLINAFAKVVAMGPPGIAVIVSAVTAFLMLIPMVATQIALGIISFVTAIAASATSIVGAITVIIIAIVGALTAAAVVIAGAVLEIGIAVLDTITKLIPPFMLAVTTLGLEILQTIKELIPPFMECVLTFLESILQLLVEFIPQVVVAAVEIVVAILEGIAEKLPDVINAAFDLVISFIQGLADAVEEKNEDIFAACGDLIMAIIDSCFAFFDQLEDLGVKIAGKVLEAIGLVDSSEEGEDLINGFIDGVKEMASDLKDSLVDVVSGAWGAVKDFFGIKSPSRLAAEAGMYIDQGLAGGLEKFAKVVKNSAVGVGETAMTGLQKSMSNISDVINSDADFQPTIRPVLDLSDVQAGSNMIGGMFGKQTVALAGVANGITISNSSNLANLASQMEKINESGNNDVVDAISGLRNDFNSLSDAISKMKITMDSGVVVGELVGKIDNSLGRISNHKERGN